MNRHIKVRAVLVHPDNKFVDVTFVSATHKGVQFGGNSGNFVQDVFDHGNVKFRAKGIAGSYSPNCQGEGHLSLTLGYDVEGATVRIPRSAWPAVKEAVKAYNIWGDSGGKQQRCR